MAVRRYELLTYKLPKVSNFATYRSVCCGFVLVQNLCSFAYFVGLYYICKNKTSNI